jgi:CRISPR-associated protein Csx10
LSGWQAGGTGSQVVYRVRVNPLTRRAEARGLFSQENGDGRLSFRFTVVGTGDEDMLLDEAALLIAAARNIRELGRSRRRGQGECRIHLVEPTTLLGLILAENESLEKKLLDRFKELWLSQPTTSSTVEKSVTTSEKRGYSNQAEAWKIRGGSFPTVSTLPTGAAHSVRMRLILRANEPITIAQRGDAGNQFETLKVISGTTLRGAFATKVIEHSNLKDIANYTDFVQLFLRGQVHFPFLYPARRTDNNLYPTIPAPRDFLTCKIFPGLKEFQHGAQGFATEGPNIKKNCPKCDTQLQSLIGFVVVQPSPQVLEIRERSEMHIRMNPERQRVEEEGGLFTYTALETGQYFVGEITFSDETTWQRFQEMTGLSNPGQTFELRLGKAARRGYGHVTACLEPCGDKEPVLIRIPFEKRVLDPTQPLTLTLLTDIIITDPWGRFRLGFEADWLTQELGVPVDQTRFSVFASIRLVDGFHAHLGLPYWRDIAIAAGSSVGLTLVNLSGDWKDKLKAVEQNGIGLRREEGFGRVVFNHPIYHNDQGIPSSDITLNEDLRLTARVTTGKHELSKETQFHTEWKKVLDKVPDKAPDNEPAWDKCKDPQFVSVARWLHTNCHKALIELKKELETLGEPDKDLRAIIPDYGSRSKEKKISREGINLIIELLKKLEEKNPTDRHRAFCVAMLAERVSAAANPKQ